MSSIEKFKICLDSQDLVWTADIKKIAGNKNNLLWLTKPYKLSQHFKTLVPDYQFSLEQESWVKNQKNQKNQHDNRFERWIAHRAGVNILAWGCVQIPEETYQAYKHSFGELKSNPIGDQLLFNNPEVIRGEFLYARVNNYMARKSIFYWRGLPLVIIEIFNFPSSLQDLAPLPQVGKGMGEKAEWIYPKYQSLNHFSECLKLKFHTNYLYRAAQKLKDYAKLIRLHRPIPILLMLWPTLSALFLAKQGFPGFKLLIIFILGVFFTRSAGDVINDLTDKNLDGKITRTKIRPMATGRVKTKEALILIFIFGVLSLFLLLFLNFLTFYLSLIAVGLTLVYPWMKRFTYFPQVILGLAYNFGILMAYSAVQNKVPGLAIAWWLLAALWTVAYDTMYAMADVKDDVLSEIKSTAVLFGSQVLNIILFMQILCLITAGILGYLEGFKTDLFFLYYLSLFISIFFGLYQRFLLKTPSISHCIAAFNNNHWIGLLIFLGISIQFS